MTEAVGEIIGDYEVIERLATGGMAEVFIARRSGPHGFSKRVALKRILPQYAKDVEFVEMFIEEARLAAELQHPNIVQVFDFGEDDANLFIAMELVEGTNVNRLLRASAAAKEPVARAPALMIARDTARALSYAHRSRDTAGNSRNLVHRDVSPANILLTANGDVKLADFGIATAAERTSRTESGHVRGKLGYMSPEQVMGHPLTGKSDVFTLSVVLAEMLLIERLFGSGKDLDVLLRIRDVDLSVLDRAGSTIPRHVRNLLERGLAKNPADRISAGDFAEACDEVARRHKLKLSARSVSKMLATRSLVDRRNSTRPPPSEGGEGISGIFDEESASSEDLSRYSEVPEGAVQMLEDDGSVSTSERTNLKQVQADSYVVKTENREIGPLPYPSLVQLVTSGEVNEGDLLSRNGQPFMPLQESPDLARFFATPGLHWDPEDQINKFGDGPLAGGELFYVVFRIAIRRKSGVLHLWQTASDSRTPRRKKIYFVDGQPEFVASTDSNELLGGHLVREGFCLPMEIDMALAILPQYGGRLGDALVGIGILRPIELFRALNSQVKERILDAFRWRHGRWSFIAGERSEEEAFPFKHNAFELLREAVLEAHPAELEAALDPVREEVILLNHNAPMPIHQFRLPVETRLLIESVGEGTTFGALLAKHSKQGGSPIEVYQAVHLALACELLEFELASKRTTRPHD